MTLEKRFIIESLKQYMQDFSNAFLKKFLKKSVSDFTKEILEKFLEEGIHVGIFKKSLEEFLKVPLKIVIKESIRCCYGFFGKKILMRVSEKKNMKELLKESLNFF